VRDLWNDEDHREIKQGLINEILKWRIRSYLTTQGWTEAIIAEGAGHTPAKSGRNGR